MQVRFCLGLCEKEHFGIFGRRFRLVDKACRANWISEESAILINGTISLLSKTCQG